MTLTMMDSIHVADLPGGMDAYAGYVDGRWPTITELRERFPHRHILSIAVFAVDDAQCLDIETGDATPGEFPAWARRQHEQRHIIRPCAYASVSVMDEVIAAYKAAGMGRADVRLWSAHYKWKPGTDAKHICGPATCGLVSIPMDGTQWRNDAPGVGGTHVDESVLAANFFPVVATPAPPPLFGYLVTESSVGNAQALTGRAVTSTDGGRTWA